MSHNQWPICSCYLLSLFHTSSLLFPVPLRRVSPANNSPLTHLHACRLVCLLSVLPKQLREWLFQPVNLILSRTLNPSAIPFYLQAKFSGPWHVLKGWFIIWLLLNCPLPSAKILYGVFLLFVFIFVNC